MPRSQYTVTPYFRNLVPDMAEERELEPYRIMRSFMDRNPEVFVGMSLGEMYDMNKECFRFQFRHTTFDLPLEFLAVMEDVESILTPAEYLDTGCPHDYDCVVETYQKAQKLIDKHFSFIQLPRKARGKYTAMRQACKILDQFYDWEMLEHCPQHDKFEDLELAMQPSQAIRGIATFPEESHIHNGLILENKFLASYLLAYLFSCFRTLAVARDYCDIFGYVDFYTSNKDLALQREDRALERDFSLHEDAHGVDSE